MINIFGFDSAPPTYRILTTLNKSSEPQMLDTLFAFTLILKVSPGIFVISVSFHQNDIPSPLIS
jgi:hypothetical protein